jgi:hypothetical protein
VTLTPRARAAVPAALLAAALGLAVADSPRPAAAAPDRARDEVLGWVPADAALFVHLDVGAVWRSKVGDTFRKADPLDKAELTTPLAAPAAEAKGMPKDKTAMEKDKMAMEKDKGKEKSPAGTDPRANKLADGLKQLQAATGIAPDDVRTFTLYMPRLKGPGDEETILFAVTLSKPFDKAKLVAGLGQLASSDRSAMTEVAPGVYEVGPTPKDKNESAKLGRPTRDNPRLILSDPNRIVFLGAKLKEIPKARETDAAGPITPALTEAAAGRTGVLALNFAQFPDEVRGDGLPAQVEPFKPLLRSDAIIATADLADKLTLTVRAVTGDRTKAVEAEKSMGVLRGLLSTVVAAGIQQADKAKADDPEMTKGLLAFLETSRDALRAAKFASTETEASATLSVPAGADYGPVLQAVFGVNRVRAAAARSRTQNNLKQIALAMHNYHDAHGSMPTAATVARKGKLLHSWRVAVLPYVEQDALYRKFKLDEPWDSAHNKKVFEENPMPAVFAVEGVNKPGDKDTHFQVFRGNGAMFEVIRGVKLADITDGTSNTVMVATAKTPVPWTKPDDIEFDPKADPRDLLLFVDDVCNLALGDGSVRAIRKTISADTLRALVTRNGGEVVGNDF